MDEKRETLITRTGGSVTIEPTPEKKPEPKKATAVKESSYVIENT